MLNMQKQMIYFMQFFNNRLYRISFDYLRYTHSEFENFRKLITSKYGRPSKVYNEGHYMWEVGDMRIIFKAEGDGNKYVFFDCVDEKANKNAREKHNALRGKLKK